MRLPFDSLKQSVASHPPTKSLWGGGVGVKRVRKEGKMEEKRGN